MTYQQQLDQECHNLADLVMNTYGEVMGEEAASLFLAKRLFKDTSSGCCFYRNPVYVSVSGYVEGWDGQCPSHRLDFPFTAAQFWAEVSAGDKEACEIWNEIQAEEST